MTGQRRTPQDAARRRALADAANRHWTPRRGDLALDERTKRIGVVVAVPEDTGTSLYHLRPEGGGEEWTAPLDALTPHPDSAADGVTLDEAAMPPRLDVDGIR
jgi:hypothetical protein